MQAFRLKNRWKKPETTVAIPSLEQVEQERSRLSQKNKFSRALLSTISILVVIAAVSVLLSTLLFPVLQVAGTSMEPVLDNGDLLVMVKTGDLETGDLIGFRQSGKVLLKRVIAGPGDLVEIDESGNVYVNGEFLQEPYIQEKSAGICDITYPYQVPEKSYFVLGDHRSDSIDSRMSIVGCVHEEQIIGKALLKVWPLTSFEIFEQ